jgi:hypothetical protein
MIMAEVILGTVLGFMGALLGGALDLYLGNRSKSREAGGPMLLLVGIGNTVMGIAAIALSYLLTGRITAALYVGVGIFAGFGLGFLLLATLWIKRESSAREENDHLYVERPGGAEDG